MRNKLFIQRLIALALFISLLANTSLQSQNQHNDLSSLNPAQDLTHFLDDSKLPNGLEQEKLPPQETFFIEINYAKVEPGMMPDYLKLIGVAQKIQQQRKEKGEILYWTIFKRLYPSGTEANFDMVSITAFKSGANLEFATKWDDLAKATPSLSPEELAFTTGKITK